MVTGRVQTIKLTVQHVRNPGYRVPVGRMQMGERPGDSPESQAPHDLLVLINVVAVVEIDKIEVARLAKHDPRYRDQENVDSQNQPAILWTLRRGGFRLTDMVPCSPAHWSCATMEPGLRHGQFQTRQKCTVDGYSQRGQ